MEDRISQREWALYGTCTPTRNTQHGSRGVTRRRCRLSLLLVWQLVTVYKIIALVPFDRPHKIFKSSSTSTVHVHNIILYRFQDTVTYLLNFQVTTWRWTHPISAYRLVPGYSPRVNPPTKFEMLCDLYKCCKLTDTISETLQDSDLLTTDHYCLLGSDIRLLPMEWRHIRWALSDFSKSFRWPLKFFFQMQPYVCLSWQDFNGLHTSRSPSMTAESLDYTKAQ